MASETPRIDPSEITGSSTPVFRLVAQVKAQPTESTLVLSGVTEGQEPITLTNVRVSIGKPFEIDQWYEMVCRANDNGEVGFLVLDAVQCVFPENEEISLEAVVALQKLSRKFPEIY